jgi:dihydroorotate dehydrogenase (NAD+) catalytic subunit
LADLLGAVRPAVTRAKLIVKLSPNAGTIMQTAQTAVNANVDAQTLVNTIPGMAIDIQTRKPKLSRIVGGYSGPGMHPIAVRMVHEVYRQVCKDARIPIIGLGGVMGWEDAAEFILAGATAVGIGTALYVDPRRAVYVAKGHTEWVAKQRCANNSELTGALQT